MKSPFNPDVVNMQRKRMISYDIFDKGSFLKKRLYLIRRQHKQTGQPVLICLARMACNSLISRFLGVIVPFFALFKIISTSATPQATSTVAIRLSGGVGDVVNARFVIDNLIRRLNLNDTKIDVFYKNTAICAAAFNTAPWINKTFNEARFSSLKNNYELVIDLTDYLSYEITLPHSLIIRDNPELQKAIRHNKAEIKKFDFEIRHHPYLDNSLAVQAEKKALNRLSLPLAFAHPQGAKFEISSPQLFLTDKEQSILIRDRFSLTGKRYITIHDGHDSCFGTHTSQSTKQWSPENWQTLVRYISQFFPDILIVQLGTKDSHPISGVSLNLAGQTTIAEAFAVLKNSMLHIDGDSGMVRAAWIMGTQSVVMFGPTSANYYGLPGNINIQSESCHSCWWLDDNWMNQCPRKAKTPQCMQEIEPKFVFEQISKILSIKNRKQQ
ncbi:glycosyltransferase family 9 protein [Azospira inquinata]|uniref:Glycosyltransferase family 9 protein n=1 Tax=Azospira inquinata TaxID=2785627 RepID=A0A975SKD3_9RHOO|nr:glycosyltransferase family 9 protein [Azospira inquinata]QWT46742.1 glycosyltransferase family 9 protein [Azospira inquinata]QWT47934.1 glycosyltransferase family 9 protein [Azospira inquinata]